MFIKIIIAISVERNILIFSRAIKVYYGHVLRLVCTSSYHCGKSGVVNKFDFAVSTLQEYLQNRQNK